MNKKKKDILSEKSYAFALDIIKLYKFLVSEKKEYVMSKQLLRSGTSIGALIREATYAQSKPDFLNKMNIALKEAHETEYWLDLLKDTNYINMENYNHLKNQVTSLIKLLVSTVKTTKKNLGR